MNVQLVGIDYVSLLSTGAKIGETALNIYARLQELKVLQANARSQEEALRIQEQIAKLNVQLAQEQSKSQAQATQNISKTAQILAVAGGIGVAVWVLFSQ